jgi:hypothetical protein
MAVFCRVVVVVVVAAAAVAAAVESYNLISSQVRRA